MGEEAPLDASAIEIEDGIDDRAQINRPFAARTRRLRQQGGDERPFVIGKIAGIAPTTPVDRWRWLFLHGHGSLLSPDHSFPCRADSTMFDFCTTSQEVSPA